MDRRYRTLIVVGVAVLMASLASFGVYRAIQRITVREKLVRAAVVVINKTPADTVLADTDLKVMDVPAAMPHEGGFSTIADVHGRRLKKALNAGDPVTEDALEDKEPGSWLAMKIRPGMRAMSVRVNEVINVAGFVVAGTFVDVVVSERQSSDSVAKIVLSNVEVLTAGSKTDSETLDERRRAIAKDAANQDKYQDKPVISTVVTLLVTPAEAEKLALAQSEGSITLTLRNPNDALEVRTEGTSMSKLFGTGRRAAPVEPAAPKTIVGIHGLNAKPEIKK